MSDHPLLSPRNRRIARWAAILIAVYLSVAYLLLPLAWESYAHRHPEFDGDPRITTTGDDHPGDPLNVALVARDEELAAAMQAAGWYPAAALGLRSDLEIAGDTVLSRPDVEAPVSNLFLFGRKEDHAFEQPVGDNPRQRHHVRFWKLDRTSDDGRPVWIGAASYDLRVGLSHTTGQVTHHIDGHVDVERDHLFNNLRDAGKLQSDYYVDGFHTRRAGSNGGGDQWQTDGRLLVGVVKPAR
ncbi:MAG: LssY C-terminal domain-containing protein [Pirellulales bacterium]|nr:LssY C-terminal domain-containing protein [Pirellulales bacterium]